MGVGGREQTKRARWVGGVGGGGVTQKKKMGGGRVLKKQKKHRDLEPRNKLYTCGPSPSLSRRARARALALPYANVRLSSRLVPIPSFPGLVPSPPPAPSPPTLVGLVPAMDVPGEPFWGGLACGMSAGEGISVPTWVLLPAALLRAQSPLSKNLRSWS